MFEMQQVNIDLCLFYVHAMFMWVILYFLKNEFHTNKWFNGKVICLFPPFAVVIFPFYLNALK